MVSIMKNMNADPATLIARQWYLGREMVYEGVDLGMCMEYDVLQITNRILIEANRPKKKAVMSVKLG